MKLTSEQLTALALKARTDEYALNELIAHEAVRAIWFVRRNVNPRHRNDYEDITQEILMAIANGVPEFKGKSPYNTWSYSLMYNRLGDWFRRMRRRTYMSEDLYDNDNMEKHCGTCEIDFMLESEDEFEALLDMAPHNGRENLRLRFGDGYSIAKIVEMQGDVGYEKVRSKMRRDLEYIKHKLERRTENESLLQGRPRS